MIFGTDNSGVVALPFASVCQRGNGMGTGFPCPITFTPGPGYVTGSLEEVCRYFGARLGLPPVASLPVTDVLASCNAASSETLAYVAQWTLNILDKPGGIYLLLGQNFRINSMYVQPGRDDNETHMYGCELVQRAVARPPLEFLVLLTPVWLGSYSGPFPDPSFTEEELCSVLDEIMKSAPFIPAPAIRAIRAWRFSDAANLILSRYQKWLKRLDKVDQNELFCTCPVMGTWGDLLELAGIPPKDHHDGLRLLEWIIGKPGFNPAESPPPIKSWRGAFKMSKAVQTPLDTRRVDRLYWNNSLSGRLKSELVTNEWSCNVFERLVSEMGNSKILRFPSVTCVEDFLSVLRYGGFTPEQNSELVKSIISQRRILTPRCSHSTNETLTVEPATSPIEVTPAVLDVVQHTVGGRSLAVWARNARVEFRIVGATCEHLGKLVNQRLKEGGKEDGFELWIDWLRKSINPQE